MGEYEIFELVVLKFTLDGLLDELLKFDGIILPDLPQEVLVNTFVSSS
jgi:hypothetical protein